MKKSFFALLAVLTAVLFVSCATERGGVGYDISSTNTGGQYVLSGSSYSMVAPTGFHLDYSDPNADIPLTSSLAPENIVTSPVIDISKLREIEGYSGNAAISAIEAQASAKNEIEKQIKAGLDVDTNLQEENYGTSSASLSAQATKDALEYVSNPSFFHNSIAEYTFTDGRIYEIVTAPKSFTDLRLQPGEVLSGEILISDPDNWLLSLGTSIENGQEILHIAIRPRIVGLDSSMRILTNYRTYYLRLGSFSNYYMTGVRFVYAKDYSTEYEKYVEKNAINSAYKIDSSRADYEYAIDVVQPKTKKGVSWAPTTVYSSGEHTFIVFPTSVNSGNLLPSLSVSSDGGKTDELVYFRVNNNLWMVDYVLLPGQMFLLKTDREQVNIVHR